MNHNQHDIFSVPIWGFVLNDQTYQSKDYLEAILELEKTQPSVKKSNSGGYQTPDNIHKIPVFREFSRSLETIASSCVKHRGVISEMWANINYKYCYNESHVHGGCLSGVFYLKVPANSGRLVLRNPAVRSDNHFIRSSNYPIIPDNLVCIMFPSWLEHYVEPNMSDEPRISISFNFELIKS